MQTRRREPSHDINNYKLRENGKQFGWH